MADNLALQPNGISHRRQKHKHRQRNLDHLAHLIAAASWLSSLDLPVRLVVLPEGALQGFTDEVFDLDHVTYARDCAIDVPGPETRFLGDLAKHWNVFIMGQAKARHEAFPDRFFNVGFVIRTARSSSSTTSWPRWRSSTR
jgi:predicted amidohydrolase